ncbi:hypothetical protein [Pelagovum pacificum]|uniref:Uncharacterized protein n=1 Tax=Pelagovum pacificum TaxID=2588711 RepID=A0A5C5GDZ1_9RHOB|nr:hypothetical protein [Pelagovum pacificum]QQA43953.1 hypothetical protein I8N54_05075 [Pelagovum pacificum]TNY32918.1 hypothetical protein FHY64_06475 [Pelagovum pacificum]
MKKIRITAKDGATITGPVTLKLTGPQHLAHTDVLGARWRRAGLFDLLEGEAVTFARGEVLALEPVEAVDRAAADPIGWEWPVKKVEPKTAKAAPDE